MKNELYLIGKKIVVDKSPVVLSYTPDENFRDVWY